MLEEAFRQNYTYEDIQEEFGMSKAEIDHQAWLCGYQYDAASQYWMRVHGTAPQVVEPTIVRDTVGVGAVAVVVVLILILYLWMVR